MIYGIGIDLVKVARIEKVLERYGDRFLAHVFSRDRLLPGQGVDRLCLSYALCRQGGLLQGFGGGPAKRWHSWREVEVIPNPLGKPELSVSGRAAEFCTTAGIANMHLSLTANRPAPWRW